MKKVQNMDELSAVIGASRTTLSKYFNTPEKLRKSTRERIEAALATIDYRPNVYAMNQNRKLTSYIGIVIHYMADPLFGEIAHLLEDRVVAAGFQPLTFSSRGNPDEESKNLTTMLSLRPAGVIMAPIGAVTNAQALKLFCRQVPTVLFDRDIANIDAHYVGTDNFQSISLMVDYLRRFGEPPCFVEVAPINPNANTRREAYKAAMKAQGLKPSVVRLDGGGWIFEEIGVREGKKLLTSKDLPSKTILCSNDRLAVGLMTAAFELGLKVGVDDDCDLRIAGHDNHPFSRYTSPSLTTIAQNYEAIARTCVDTILRSIKSDTPSSPREKTLIETNLLLRRSA